MTSDTIVVRFNNQTVGTLDDSTSRKNSLDPKDSVSEQCTVRRRSGSGGRGSQNHVCSECDKRFSRQDVLKRHVRLLHSTQSQVKKVRRTKRKSCLRCVVCKLKCTGGDTCTQCLDRNIVCIYDFEPATGAINSDSSARVGNSSHDIIPGPEHLIDQTCPDAPKDTPVSDGGGLNTGTPITDIEGVSPLPCEYPPSQSLRDQDQQSVPNESISSPDGDSSSRTNNDLATMQLRQTVHISQLPTSGTTPIQEFMQPNIDEAWSPARLPCNEGSTLDITLLNLPHKRGRIESHLSGQTPNPFSPGFDANACWMDLNLAMHSDNPFVGVPETGLPQTPISILSDGSIASDSLVQPRSNVVDISSASQDGPIKLSSKSPGLPRNDEAFQSRHRHPDLQRTNTSMSAPSATSFETRCRERRAALDPSARQLGDLQAMSEFRSKSQKRRGSARLNAVSSREEGDASRVHDILDGIFNNSATHLPDMSTRDSGLDDLLRIPEQQLASYWDSYFEQYAPGFPLLHRHTMSRSNCPKLLLVVMTTIGASHTPSANARSYFELASNKLRAWFSATTLFDDGTDGLTDDDTTILLAFCIFNYFMTRMKSWSYIAECLANSKTALQVAIRTGIFLDEGFSARFSPDNGGPRFSGLTDRCHDQNQLINELEEVDDSNLLARWMSWKDMEQRKRLAWGLIIYAYSVAHLLGTPPLFPMIIVNMRLPSFEDFWDAENATTWSSRLGWKLLPPRDLPAIPTLISVIADEISLARISRFGKVVCTLIIGLALSMKDDDLFVTNGISQCGRQKLLRALHALGDTLLE